jgi:hypothetical protein
MALPEQYSGNPLSCDKGMNLYEVFQDISDRLCPAFQPVPMTLLASICRTIDANSRATPRRYLSAGIGRTLVCANGKSFWQPDVVGMVGQTRGSWRPRSATRQLNQQLRGICRRILN